MIKMIGVTFVGACLLAALPHYASSIQDMMQARKQEQAAQTVAAARDASNAAPAQTATASYAAGRSLRLQRDASGHFTGDFRVNGRPLNGLIDTGATLVAINLGTARKLGLNVGPNDFTYVINTANGETSAARVVLERMEIGSIRAEDVETFVLDDPSLSINLVGMSFLNKLQSFRVENGEMLLIN